MLRDPSAVQHPSLAEPQHLPELPEPLLTSRLNFRRRTTMPGSHHSLFTSLRQGVSPRRREGRRREDNYEAPFIQPQAPAPAPPTWAPDWAPKDRPAPSSPQEPRSAWESYAPPSEAPRRAWESDDPPKVTESRARRSTWERWSDQGAESHLVSLVRSVEMLAGGLAGALLGAAIAAAPVATAQAAFFLPYQQLTIPLGAAVGMLAAFLLVWKRWDIERDR